MQCCRINKLQLLVAEQLDCAVALNEQCLETDDDWLQVTSNVIEELGCKAQILVPATWLRGNQVAQQLSLGKLPKKMC